MTIMKPNHASHGKHASHRLVAGVLLVLAFHATLFHATLCAQTPSLRLRSDPPVITSSWDDLLTGVTTRDDWEKHRAVLIRRYLELIRD